jgi:ATP diphosphatase
VFARKEGDVPLAPDEVVTRWEQIKAKERGESAKPQTLLGGVPAALPALLRAYQIGLRARSVGFDWSKPGEVIDKIQEEVDELREAVNARGSLERAEDEMGDLLFSIANLARHLGIEPETALRKANDKFTKRFETMERAVAQSGRAMSEMNIDELERVWQQAKSAQPAP